MEREIKFRAWDEANKKMTKSMLLEDLILKASLQNPDTFQWDSEIPMMQYTGLKDKNGVEIYEGDIMKSTGRNKEWNGHPPKSTMPKGIKVIRFWNGGFIMSRKPSNKSRRYNLTSMTNTWNSFEVIGNIHENPELL